MSGIHSANFGLNSQPANSVRISDASYDPWFWQDEEVRAAKRQARLDKKASEANQNNAMANAMNAVAQDLVNNPAGAAPPPQNHNTTMFVVGGLVLATLLIGGAIFLAKRRKGQGTEVTESLAAEMPAT